MNIMKLCISLGPIGKFHGHEIDRKGDDVCITLHMLGLLLKAQILGNATNSMVENIRVTLGYSLRRRFLGDETA